MKKLILVSMGKSTGEEMARQISSLIGERVILKTVLMSEITEKNIECDLILFTGELTAKVSLHHFSKNTPYIIAKRLINHKNIGEVISLPAGTEVLLVNDSQSTAYEAIEQLMEIGLDHVKYYPVYPGCGPYPKLDIAVTPGEAWLVPRDVREIIDIGTRILDIRTIHEIISRLDIEDVLQESLVTGYIKDIVEITRTIEVNRKSVIESQKLLETILNSVESGIAYIDSCERLVTVNAKFESIFGKKRKDLLMKKITELIDGIDIFSKENKTLIIEIEGREVLIDVDQVNFEKNSGYLITANDTDQISKLDHKIRRNYEKKITRKLYTFRDYLTVCPEVKEMLRRAEKFAKTDATLLIQGENGTGKEILAQAVHMNSYRRKKPFIPINIAAISPSLLESELFGYEEGAFTGARKGGKIGLFEIADGGTIFIDEIGDAPLDFQVKLLRVLEEKRIRRVGALEEIPINVRVIAATNKNLLKHIDEGSFREDLFFRLNILPLKTIPLRRRQEDIPYLLMHFTEICFGKGKIQGLENLFESEVVEFLKNYKWRGNVRELVNLVEYLSYIYEGDKLGLSAMHHYMFENENLDERIILDAQELWVLKEIEKNSQQGIGRITLTQRAKKQFLDMGEGKIRGILKKLEEMALIGTAEGKRGSVIREKGITALDYYR